MHCTPCAAIVAFAGSINDLQWERSKWSREGIGDGGNVLLKREEARRMCVFVRAQSVILIRETKNTSSTAAK